MTDFILGVDEAGRGAVLGPLVVGGAVMNENRLHELRDLGVRDSKELSQGKREELDAALRKMLSKYKTLAILPDEIDRARATTGINLNDLEAQRMAMLVNEFNPAQAYIDCVDSTVQTFMQRITPMITASSKIVAKHEADRLFPIVSAASILAKVERDAAMKKLSEETGYALGSGYPSDPATQSFLNHLAKEKKPLPVFVRRSWATVKDWDGQKTQRKLAEF